MKRWFAAAGAIALLVVAFAYGARAVPSAAADCDDWGNTTAERVATARQLLYPRERQEQSTGSVQGDAQALAQLAQEQADSDPPAAGANLSGDLVEAFSAGANALGGGGGAAPEVQIAFAKAVVYNADLRVAYLLDGC